MESRDSNLAATQDKATGGDFFSGTYRVHSEEAEWERIFRRREVAFGHTGTPLGETSDVATASMPGGSSTVPVNQNDGSRGSERIEERTQPNGDTESPAVSVLRESERSKSNGEPVHGNGQPGHSNGEPTHSKEPAPTCEGQTTRPRDLVGLALSGGGLRSALFNDGLLQALSHRGFLRYVDYICSVSGGGYIAGHLMTHAKKHVNSPNDQQEAAGTAVEKAANFHDSGAGEGNIEKPCFEPWHFGRHPSDGREDASRLAGIGGYLNRSGQFFAGYCLRQIPLILLYLSFVGLFATLLALYYRSFDEPLFRSVYFGGLGVQFGDELWLAFMPPLIIAVPTLGCAFLAWLPIGRFKNIDRAQHYLRIAAKVGFWIVVFLVAASIAVYLGNDLTKATSDPAVSNHHRLNHFALQMTIVAGVVQVLVFFGRDRLFRSERSEAARWKKLTQAFIANGVVCFLVFTMIHWMAKENLSGYTTSRDPYLVRGDVNDWRLLVDLFNRYDGLLNPGVATDTARVLARLQWNEWAHRAVLGESTAHRRWADVWEPAESARPPSPAELRDRQHKPPLPSAGQRYKWLALSCLFRPPLLSGNSLELGGEPWKVPTADVPNQCTSFRQLWEAADRFHTNQQRYLYDHNTLLESSRFTVLLLGHIAAAGVQEESLQVLPESPSGTPLLNAAGTLNDDSSPVAEKNAVDAPNVASSWQTLLAIPHLQSRIPAPTSVRRSQLEIRLKQHDHGILDSHEPTPHAADNRVTPWTQWQTAANPNASLGERVALNRALLELIAGDGDRGVIRFSDIASTRTVQPHDQATRWRWAFFWASVLAVSLVLTADLNRNSYIFGYYHRALSRNFLRRASPPRYDRTSGTHTQSSAVINSRNQLATGGWIEDDTEVEAMRPEESGLPLPIFLTTWLKPSSRRGMGITPTAVAITPLGTTVRDAQAVHGKAFYGTGVNARPVTLADAVAASGAAISPMMTNNPALTLLMDFFGARLGFWLRLDSHHPGDGAQPEQEAEPRKSTAKGKLNATFWGYLILLSGCVLAALGSVVLFSYPYHLLTFWACIIVVILFRMSMLLRVGYPGLLQSLATSWYHASATSESPSYVSAQRVAQCWPTKFISDGGFYDYLGVTELLLRRCELIIVSDAGINTGATALESLATMCERASAELGVRFVDLDHDTAIEFARLRRNEQQMAPQPFIAMRVKYPAVPNSDLSGEPQPAKEGLLFYVQMAITERDPIEIQQIRHRFPSFPDEPTTNQFYTPAQVAAYRDLGYHIGNRLCFHLHRWTSAQIRATVSPVCQNQRMSYGRQPLLGEVRRRLRRAYIQTCFQEHYFSADDVYSESIWRDNDSEGVFPAFQDAVTRLQALTEPVECSREWLDQFTHNADVFSCYMEAVNRDVNPLSCESLKPRMPGCAAIYFYHFLACFGDQVDLLRPENVRGEGAAKAQCHGRVYLAELCLESVVMALKQKDDLHKDLEQHWAAHLTVVAAAAQQLHRGVPHAIFQVGGREKLCSLTNHLVRDLVDVLTTSQGIPLPEMLQRLAAAMIHEVFELAECVFQDADRLTVVSFVQCLCKEIAVLNNVVGTCDLNGVRSTNTKDDEHFSLALDFRQLLLDKLHSGYRSKAQSLIADYLYFLYDPQYDGVTGGHPIHLQRIVNPAAGATRIGKLR